MSPAPAKKPTKASTTSGPAKPAKPAVKAAAKPAKAAKPAAARPAKPAAKPAAKATAAAKAAAKPAERAKPAVRATAATTAAAAPRKASTTTRSATRSPQAPDPDQPVETEQPVENEQPRNGTPSEPIGQTVLEALQVTKKFGGLTAVSEVDFVVRENEIVGLIGPNGAGKTTFFNCLTGMETPTGGRVTYRGQPVTGQPYDITKMGLARTFQNIRLFPNMTALENVLVGRHSRTKSGVLTVVAHGPLYRREEREAEQRARELLDFVNLGRSANTLAKNLPYGDQRRLEIARALATDPGLLLLDEPTAGMNPQETAAAMQLVRRIREQGLAVVVIEHDMKFIFNLCDRVAVLVQGKKLVEGTPSEVQADPRVVEAYLGTPHTGEAS
ncbi:MAG TPA: ABC transporter ATP-binding protein [Frankiaceae bacterium]|nr:ABC transporter ATP-binding protein [Frankiaceae bacterium]